MLNCNLSIDWIRLVVTILIVTTGWPRVGSWKHFEDLQMAWGSYERLGV
jgi:hypothetical protein